MTEPPEKRVKGGLSSWEKKQIFDNIYNNNPQLSVDDNLFTKDSKELAEENNQYSLYLSELKRREMIEFKCEEVHKITLAQNQFIGTIGKKYLGNTLSMRVCFGLGSLLVDLVDNKLSHIQKIEVYEIIKEILRDEPKKCKKLLQILSLDKVIFQNTRIPLKSQRLVCMDGQVQFEANENDCNFIYPFPFGIKLHFPVFFCHSVFGDFMDILHERNPNNPVVSEYQNFMNTHRNEGTLVNEQDECMANLIVAFLTKATDQDEKKFAGKVSSALSKLFPSVKSNLKVKSEIPDLSPEIKMDAAVLIGGFPFIILEAKKNSYSINAVLQGFQYYGLTTAEFIDNDPCFLVTFDKGIFYLYGMAKVNCRVVCSCLLSLEFTNYHFNIEGFTGTLYRCLSGLYFFYKKFEARISAGKTNDLQHQKYLSIRSAPGFKYQPFPAIFSVKSEANGIERIEITFDKVLTKTMDGNFQVHAPYLKPCVYLVKTSTGKSAVLKLACDYDINFHRKLCCVDLAPKIYGYEKICGQYHVILMEYFENSDNIYTHLHDNISLNGSHLFDSLKNILVTLRNLNLVHGDFRSSNILAKRSDSDPSILIEFKLIDFDFSGTMNEPYPFLAMKSKDLKWPEGFNSFMPRTFDHDSFMLNEMYKNEIIPKKLKYENMKMDSVYNADVEF